MEHSAATQKDIDQAARILREGGLIAFPTETYYGLAVDPFNERALQRLFSVKNRPSVKPVLVLIPSREDITRMALDVPEVAERLMDRFWPGPLTLVLAARNELSELLTGYTGTIGLRFSPHPVAQSLLLTFNGPLTATSANLSGGKAAVTENEVNDIFGNDVDMILTGGRTPGHKPSTLIGFAGETVKCLREGCIPFSDIMRTVAPRI